MNYHIEVIETAKYCYINAISQSKTSIVDKVYVCVKESIKEEEKITVSC